MDRSSRRCGRCEGRAWPVLGAVAGAGGSSDGPRVRIRPPACCAARHRCSQRRCARHSSWLDRRLPPSGAWSRPRRSAPARALLILPRAADRRCSGRAWWRQAARARRTSRPTCSCAGAPWHHLIAWLRLLSIDLQLDGAMSSPGPAAKLALKWQTGLMGGDTGHDWAAQAQRSASAAQPAAAASAAAVATGTYTICRRIRSAVTSGVSAAAQHQRCPAQGRRQGSR